MLSLIRFLSRHIFFIQFLVLELFCFYLIIQNSYYQKASFISSSNSLTGSVYDTYNSFIEYFTLKETNETLARENAMFRNNSLSTYIKVFGKTVVINDSTYQQKYTFKEGKIVNKSTHKRNNYFTIDKGELHGIEPGMGVITGQGVIGIVKHTSTNYCSVMSVLHKDITISAKIKKNDYFGFLTWDGVDYRIAQLRDIPVHVKLNVGDTIVTSGYSAIFPANIPIGVIREFETPKGKNFYEINVEFLVDYKRVSYAYLVKNLFKEEQIKLEKLTETHD